MNEPIKVPYVLVLVAVGSDVVYGGEKYSKGGKSTEQTVRELRTL